MNEKELIKLVYFLVSIPIETEWLEFKLNFHTPDEIGERISALANSAALHNKPYGYLVFGAEDNNHNIVGTNFRAKSHKKGNEDLEMWILNRLNPRINFECFEFDYKEGVHISLYKIPATTTIPVEFFHHAYIRVNTMTKKLGEYREKEAKLWRKADKITLEKKIAKTGLSHTEIISLLSVETYFDLMKIPQPQDIYGIINRFEKEKLIISNNGQYDITILGAILFAKDLSNFGVLSRKAIRVIVYKGTNKIETIREQVGTKGYAVGFTGLLDWVNGQLPANEEIGKALRKNVKMYPEIAVRELIANCIIHQDFEELGFPMVEIYADRVEISNPGIPLIRDERFIDEYVSRNEVLADIMRRMGFCEEKGSGLDKTIFFNELYQLPALKILRTDRRITITLYAYKKLNDTDLNDKIRACYQHACLKYVSNDKMTNQSLRDRFKIDTKNYSIASRIIKATIEAGLIKEFNPDSSSKKYASYIPFWA